jgi:gliding motility-associated-like protein
LVNENPVIKASKTNDIDCLTGISHLNATGGLYYEWSPANGLDNPKIPNPVAAVDTTTTFTVAAVDANNCVSSDTVTVLVTSRGKVLFVLPNAFTPNNDGHNDCFGIKNWGNVNIEEFSIFNRWGQRIFDTKNPGACWDGTCGGETQPAGGYTYIIKANSFCGHLEKQGVVLLIR